MLVWLVFSSRKCIRKDLKYVLQRTFEERKRGEARKSWLNDIDMAARTSGILVDGVYQATFQALSNDAEAHGRGKVTLICILCVVTRQRLLSVNEILTATTGPGQGHSPKQTI